MKLNMKIIMTSARKKSTNDAVLEFFHKSHSALYSKEHLISVSSD